MRITRLRLVIDISSEFTVRCLDAFLEGLADYTTDERGDVGSWIRIPCVRGLSEFIQILFTHSKSLQDFAEYLPPEQFHAAIGGILKQGVERLDNVRQQTGAQFLKLLHSPLPEVDDKERWKISGTGVINNLFSEWVRSPYLISHSLTQISQWRVGRVERRSVVISESGPLSRDT